MTLKKLLSCWALITFLLCSPSTASIVEHFEFPEDGGITQKMVDSFNENGFLLLDGFQSTENCQHQIDVINAHLRSFKLTPDKVEVFTAKNDTSDANRGRYFHDSVDKAFPFFEAGAFVDGQLVDDITSCVNKIGHAVAETLPDFGNITFTKTMRTIVESLGVQNPLVPQSMIIMKPKIRGGVVDPHQDATFLYTKDNTTLAMWTPLHDATENNGCLQVIPGSHKWPLLSRWVKAEEGMKYIDEKGDDLKDDARAALYAQHWNDEAFVSVPMKRGSVLFFPGTLVHRSSNNASADPRNAYTCHFIGGSGDNYPANNWLQRKDGFKPIWMAK